VKDCFDGYNKYLELKDEINEVSNNIGFRSQKLNLVIEHHYNSETKKELDECIVAIIFQYEYAAMVLERIFQGNTIQEAAQKCKKCFDKLRDGIENGVDEGIFNVLYNEYNSRLNCPFVGRK